MKIYKQTFDLVGDNAGNFNKNKVNIKIANITSSESMLHFRNFLVDKGYKDKISVVELPKERGQKLVTIAFFGVPIKTHFVLWKAAKDTAKGKADFFIGQPNVKKYEDRQVKHSYILRYKNSKGEEVSRILHKRVPWFCFIVTNRSIRQGMDITSQDFVEYMLVPLEYLKNHVLEKGRGDWVIRREDRKKFAFDKMLPELIEYSKTYLLEEV